MEHTLQIILRPDLGTMAKNHKTVMRINHFMLTNVESSSTERENLGCGLMKTQGELCNVSY